MAELSESIKQAVTKLVDDLVQGKYKLAESDGRAGRLSAEELERAIRDYGRTLVTLPPDAWNIVDVYPIDAAHGVNALDIPLWTAEEGRSDLTLSIRAREDGTDVRIEIEDLHVL
jgi:hypothetical protein